MNLQTVLTVLQIISIVVSLSVTVFGFFVRRELKRLDDRDKENQQSHKEMAEKLEKLDKQHSNCKDACTKSLSDFKDEVSSDYVRNVDFIRVNAEIMKKLDKIFDILFDMKGRG